MPQIGQASGGFTESSSALRILHVGIRNSVGVLCDDAFTQANPAVVTTQISDQVDVSVKGVLGGSVAFIRPDVNGGADVIGGPMPTANATKTFSLGYKAIGVFLNTANGNQFENQPGVASGKGPYVSGMGCYGNQLFETKVQATANGVAAGTAITYATGVDLVASRNGFLMPALVMAGGAITSLNPADANANASEVFISATAAAGAAIVGATVVGVLKMPADSAQNELIYDQRI